MKPFLSHAMETPTCFPEGIKFRLHKAVLVNVGVVMGVSEGRRLPFAKQLMHSY